MPRDLLPPKSPPMLTASPEIQTPDRSDSFDDMDSENTTGLEFEMYSAEMARLRGQDASDQLHPYVSTLTLGDLDACVALENAAMPDNERCSRELLEYRLTACPSLSLGLFSHVSHDPDDSSKPAHDAARAPDSYNPGHKSLLLGHVIATLTTNDAITNESMGLPKTFHSHPEFQPPSQSGTNGIAASEQEPSPAAVPSKSGLPSADQPSDAPGHHPLGRTVAIHSVCILPVYQGLGLGKILMQSYLQRMESSGIADAAALIVHDKTTDWCVGSLGFTKKGPSKVTFGSGNWNDLRYEFSLSESGLWS